MGALQQSNTFVDNEKCLKDRCAGQKKGTPEFIEKLNKLAKKFPAFCKPNVPYHVHHSLLWNPVISHMKTHHTLTSSDWCSLYS
jgi:hypothetical protein